MEKSLFKELVLPIVGIAVSAFLALQQANAEHPMDRWGPHWSEDGMRGQGMGMHNQRASMARHRTFMQNGVPADYVGKNGPLSSSTEVIQSGGRLYQQQCAVCHGQAGLGDGIAAKSLTPPPAMLNHMIQMPMVVDEYLIWSISEGGQTFGTDMPAFKDKISEDEIWKIITYMRAGFPLIENNSQ